MTDLDKVQREWDRQHREMWGGDAWLRRGFLLLATAIVWGFWGDGAALFFCWVTLVFYL